MKIYFDACCVNRLTDDQTQERVVREGEAIEELIGLATSGGDVWVGSVVVEAEIARNPDAERRADAQALLEFVKQVVRLDDGIVARARKLQGTGFSEFDALHIACAESAQVDVFLTTDDRLLRGANRLNRELAVRVLNPVSFLEEVKNAAQRND
ncbi:MAG: PIN domain-containing protein [Acidobacteriaceae bacterium]|nr:PIN domain-containing protein [Acidobacteriaceae bacterium]